MVCSETHVPEPDFAVIRGTLDDYTELPTAADAFSVVEVADASYERDAGEKLAGYAQAGIQQYVIVNLRNRTAEVYTNPDPAARAYRQSSTIGANEDLAVRVGENEVLTLPLREVLP